jgi:outer membrane protein
MNATLRLASRFHVVLLLGLPLGAAAQLDDPTIEADGDQRPTWSVGLGAVAMRLPDYRGSDESSVRTLPFPAITYRSPRLHVGREGVRADLLDKGPFELDFSLSGSLPVRSAGNQAREGMPDLDPSIEIGPSLNAQLWTSASRSSELKLLLPLRAVLTVDGGLRMQGWQFGPRLYWRSSGLPGLEGWRAGLSGGPLWGSRRWHAYLYDVAPEHATTDRPAYAAPSGYAGLQALGSLVRDAGPWTLFAFVRADSVRGAAFEQSPLVRRHENLAVGVGVSRTLWRSAPQ